jgi:hypothetical protein
MRLAARIAKLERRAPPTDAACRDAVMREMAADEAAMEARLDLAPALNRVPRGPDYLQRLAADILADPALAPRLKVYAAGFAAARERAGLGWWKPGLP